MSSVFSGPKNYVRSRHGVQQIMRWIFATPWAFRVYANRNSRLRELLVTPKTEIVIEGFPRSGNTFAVAAFVYAQGRAVKVARHTHAPAQISMAIRKKLPTLILKREPVASIASLVVRDTSLSIDAAIERYYWFYSRLCALADPGIVVDFDDLISNFGAAIERLNYKFGCEFRPYQNSQENDKEVFKIVEEMERIDSGGAVRETHVARPSVAREARLSVIRAELLARRSDPSLESCFELYQVLK